MLLSIYHRLPPLVKDLAASIKGWQLQRWRYGAETGQLVQEAFARESWSAEQWRAWHEEKLARLLDRAARRVPYYRSLWEQRHRQGDDRAWERLENWPILEKDPVRKCPESFLADDCTPSRMYKDYTSGTTANPLPLWQSRNTLLQWYALFEARCRNWHGVSREDRWGMLGWQLVVPAQQKRPPFWVHNWSMRQLYLSSYNLSAEFIPYYVEALRKFRPAYLLGYSSTLYFLADECARQRIRDLRFKVILTNAEALYEYQRARIEEVFQTPVRETYGMTELAAAASECEQGRLHWFPEAGYIEVLDLDEEGVGDLVVTGLINQDMPLIRYRVGDRVRLAPKGASCPCGRKLPLLGRVEGRKDDILQTPDGRRLGRLDPIFKSGLKVREAQIVQERLDLVRLLIVPAEGYNRHQEEMIRDFLRGRLGDEVTLEIEHVDRIPRGPNGKFRAVISRIGRQ